MRTWQAKVQPHILRDLGETLAHELADITIVADNIDAKTDCHKKVVYAIRTSLQPVATVVEGPVNAYEKLR